MTVTVRVHDPERALQVVLILQDLAINGRGHEFLKVYNSVAIIVTLLDDLVPIHIVVVHNLLMYHLFELPL